MSVLCRCESVRRSVLSNLYLYEPVTNYVRQAAKMSDVSSGVQLLERVPVPSLASYTAISLGLLSCATYYR